MFRRNFWDILQNTEISPIKEVYKISKLFSKTEISINKWKSDTIEDHINSSYFLSWKYRGTSLNIAEFIESKKIINPHTIAYSSIQLDSMFLYFEFIVNMIVLIEDFEGNLDHYCGIIGDNITSILEHYNQKLFKLEEEDIFIIVEKSEKATSVSELYPDIAGKIIQYNRFSLKGDLPKKKELLLAIAHKFEGVEKKINETNPSLYRNTNTLLNNLDIRHNNKEGHNAKPIVQEMDNEALEKWYDRTYDTLLLALLYADYAEYQGEIQDLNKALKVK